MEHPSMLDPLSLRISKVRLRYTDNNSYRVPADSDDSESAFAGEHCNFPKQYNNGVPTGIRTPVLTVKG